MHPTTLIREHRRILFQRCCSHLATSDHVSGWFFSADFKRDNVVDWLLWALFSATRDDYLAEWEDELEEYLSMVEVVIGRKLDPGYNAGARCMRVTLDRVLMLHRPLIWYLVSHYRHIVSRNDLLRSGCRFCGYYYVVQALASRIPSL